VVIPLTLLVLAIWERWPPRLFGWRFFSGVLLFLALVLPWHLAMYRAFGGAFVHEYLGEQTLARATTQLERHHNPPWFFVEVLCAFAAPWIFIFPLAAWNGLRRGPLREFGIFALVVFALFTASQTRLPRYVVPMYPAIALVTADGLWRWVGSAAAAKKQGWRSGRAVSVALAVSFALSVTLTRGLRERVTSPSTSFGMMHVDRNYLPLLRSLASTQVGGPILLADDGGWMQLPAALFYTGKRLQQVWVVHRPEANGRALRYFHPMPLTEFVSAQPRLLLIPKELLAGLPESIEFRELREAGDLEIGTVSVRR
jgi:hypothetical protein